MTKYVFVTGGVVSGIGKGITASSIALLLKSRGYKVFMQKFDPYINVDPGMMSPLQHGEVFVTADGSETDLDLGHYERYIDEELNYSSSMSTGKIFSTVIENERQGVYGGGTVQIVPHITNEIKRRIYEASTSSNADIVITEIGGTIGDIESQAVLESLRQIRNELGKGATLFVHTTLIPQIYGSGELKTKPTQHSVMELRGLGIQPDIIICRTPITLNDDLKSKISLFCSIPSSHVLNAIDVQNVYQIPLNFYNQKIDELILQQFDLARPKIDLTKWNDLINKVESLDKEIDIAVVGKYVELRDAYLSVNEALKHAGYQLGTKVNINWIDTKDLKDITKIKALFKNIKGIVVPYGPAEPKIIEVIKYARVNKIPFLGIELGFQMAIIEFAKNVCNLENATSKEINELSKNPIIDLMSDIKNNCGLSNNRRIGNYKCLIKNNTLAHSLYKENSALERHRHEYELNLKDIEILEKNKMVISGYDNKTNLAEIIELSNHPYFIACQFRPEFKSRPIKPHPLFLGLLEASIKIK
ncbi:MAG: CTP synthase [Bacilli bacterium]|nr:CTP synthase [Bacilli bacterium]